MEATVIDISGLEVNHPEYGLTSYICDEKLKTIDYPFGTALENNLPIAEKLIDAFVQLISIRFPDFESTIQLLCRGSSGAIMATLFAAKLVSLNYYCKIIYFNKDGETRHGGYNFYPNNNDLIVIVDDFICTGSTVNAIYESAQKLLPEAKKQIDVVCVTGRVSRTDLNFGSKFVICKELK